MNTKIHTKQFPDQTLKFTLKTFENQNANHCKTFRQSFATKDNFEIKIFQVSKLQNHLFQIETFNSL